MMTQADDSIRDIIQTLKDQGHYDNTIIIVASDVSSTQKTWDFDCNADPTIKQYWVNVSLFKYCIDVLTANVNSYLTIIIKFPRHENYLFDILHTERVSLL